MIKETITFTDYNGTKRTRDYYFNLNTVELMRMETSNAGGLKERMERIIETEDKSAIIQIIEELIQTSYGVKTADGGFIKRKEDLEEFIASEAYPELFMKMASDAEYTTKFITGIIPANMADKLEAQKAD